MKKKRKGLSERERKEGKRDRNCREKTAVCYTKLTVDRDLGLVILGFVKQLHHVVLLRRPHDCLDPSLLETRNGVQSQSTGWSQDCVLASLEERGTWFYRMEMRDWVVSLRCLDLERLS